MVKVEARLRLGGLTAQQNSTIWPRETYTEICLTRCVFCQKKH